MTMDIREVLNQIDKEHKDMAVFVEDRVESIDLLKRIDEDLIIDHIKEFTQYYISDTVSELMEQINVSGYMDEVAELFEIRYVG